jgi:hypothetical protein
VRRRHRRVNKLSRFPARENSRGKLRSGARPAVGNLPKRRNIFSRKSLCANATLSRDTRPLFRLSSLCNSIMIMINMNERGDAYGCVVHTYNVCTYVYIGRKVSELRDVFFYFSEHKKMKTTQNLNSKRTRASCEHGDIK